MWSRERRNRLGPKEVTGQHDAHETVQIPRGAVCPSVRPTDRGDREHIAGPRASCLGRWNVADGHLRMWLIQREVASIDHASRLKNLLLDDCGEWPPSDDLEH